MVAPPSTTTPADGYDNFLEYMFDNNVPEELATDRVVKRASVRQLMTEVNSSKTADELLDLYVGKEDNLVKNLNKMKAKQEANKEVIAEIRVLMDETGCERPQDEMLATYIGREDVLLKNLKKLRAKQNKEAKVVAEIKDLAIETKLPKSVDEMLASYAGREGALLKNLQKLKVKQEKENEIKAEIQVLMTKCDISEEKSTTLFTNYEGKEEILLKNMRKMADKVDKDNATIDEIKELLMINNIPEEKHTELFTKYEGKEDELLKNMRRMTSKANKEAADKETSNSILDEIMVLMKEANIPDTKQEELFAKYEGDEEKLLKNMRRMSSSAGASDSGPNPAESTSARPSLVTANASPSKKKSATPAASPIKNMKGSDYNALIKAKNAGSSTLRTSFKKKKDYNDLVKEKKAHAKAAALAQQ